MAIKFYTDVHIAKAVTTQLQLRGIDIVRGVDLVSEDTEDLDHLEYAAREGRVIITNDEDFTRLHKE